MDSSYIIVTPLISCRCLTAFSPGPEYVESMWWKRGERFVAVSGNGRTGHQWWWKRREQFVAVSGNEELVTSGGGRGGNDSSLLVGIAELVASSGESASMLVARLDVNL